MNQFLCAVPHFVLETSSGYQMYQINLSKELPLCTGKLGCSENGECRVKDNKSRINKLKDSSNIKTLSK